MVQEQLAVSLFLYEILIRNSKAFHAFHLKPCHFLCISAWVTHSEPHASEAPVGSAGRHDYVDGAEGMVATETAAFQSLVASRLSASSHRGSKARQHLRLKLVDFG